MQQVAQQSEGHPLLLEELARARAAAQPAAARATVLGLLEIRLARRDPEDRRVLRAASIVGTVFWRGAVAKLLGDDALSASTLDATLGRLGADEIVLPSPGGRFSGEREYRFRHDLLRQAAYEMLTPEDRQLGHRLAGRWLEAHGETDAALLAEHYSLGGHGRRAARAFLDAAWRALRAGDVATAEAHATRGRATAEDQAVRGELASVLTEVRMWQGRFDEARETGWEALGTLPAGSTAWYANMAILATIASRKQGMQDARRLVDLLTEATPLDAVGAALAEARVAERVVRLDLEDEADRLLARLDEARLRAVTPLDPMVEPTWRFAVASRAGWRGETDRAIAELQIARGQFVALGHHQRHLEVCTQLVGHLAYIGYREDAWQVLDEAEALARSLQARPLLHYYQFVRGCLHSDEGQMDHAIRHLELAARAFGSMGDHLLATVSSLELVGIWLSLGEEDRALAESDWCEALGLPDSTIRAAALGRRGSVLVRRDPEGAVSLARQALAMIEERMRYPWEEMVARNAVARIFLRAGLRQEAAESIAIARDRLLERSRRLADPAARHSFLTRVPPNAAVMELARELLGTEA